jgi:hypothetical protein
LFDVVRRETGDLDDLALTGPASDKPYRARRECERLGEKRQNRLVRATALGRGRHSHFPSVSVSSDDAGTPRPGNHGQRNTRSHLSFTAARDMARAAHTPSSGKDILVEDRIAGSAYA